MGTLKRAAPLAMLAITPIYLLVNIAYFVVVPKEEILNGGRVVACVFACMTGNLLITDCTGLFSFAVYLGNMLSGYEDNTIFRLGKSNYYSLLPPDRQRCHCTVYLWELARYNICQRSR